MGILEDWGITVEDLDAVLSERPSVRGILIGFLAEYKLQRTVFNDSRIHRLQRHDDHDRSQPADFSFDYQASEYTVSVKSLQSRSVRDLNGGFTGRSQVDASDRRTVTLPDGSTLQTTCLLTGTFDILAINLFEFRQQWEFAFIANDDLPRSKYRKYTEYQRENLLATSVPLSWPLTPPFYFEPYPIMDVLRRQRRRR